MRRTPKVWGSVQKGRDPVRFAPTALKKKVMQAGGWLCHWCERPLTMETGNADHSPLPWNKGGRTVMENLVAACHA